MSSLNHTAGLLLKLSIEKLFPHAKRCRIAATSQEFSCVFDYSEDFQENYLALIEKQMKELSELPFACTERMASNVQEMCRYHGKKRLAQECEGEKGMIWFIEWGDLWAVSQTKVVPCRHFALFSLQVDGPQVIISGQAFASEQAKQTAQKKWRQYSKNNHESLAKTLELYERGHWHPRGVKLKKVIYNLWGQFLEEAQIEEIDTPNPVEYAHMTGSTKSAVWENGKDKLYFFEINLLSFALQMIQNWVNLFSLKTKWFLPSSQRGKTLEKALKNCGFVYDIEEGILPVLTLRIADAVDRFWDCSTVMCEKEKISFSLVGDVKRFIALILERFEGNLPAKLQPEHVRLLPLGEVDYRPVIEIFDRQKVRVFIDKEPLPLNEKMHRALRMKVPYVMVFGKQEAESGRLKIRAYGSKRDDIVKLENLESFLLEQQLES